MRRLKHRRRRRCRRSRCADQVLLPNYSGVPIGEIGGLEAGAFLARANDSSSVFYNPAGLTKAEKTSVSGTAGVFQFDGVSAEGLDESARTFQQVPAMFAFVLKDVLGRSDLAAGLSVDLQFTGIDRRQSVANQSRTAASLSALSVPSRSEMAATHMRVTVGPGSCTADMVPTDRLVDRPTPHSPRHTSINSAGASAHARRTSSDPSECIT